MRNAIKLAMFSLATACFFNTASAQNTKTFYVCSGTSFTMVPSVTTHTNYEWSEVSGSSNPIATTQNATVTAPTIAGTTYTTKQYALTVRDAAGCWSDADTFTVYVLPPIQVSMSGNAGPYCANNPASVTLTATVGSLTLPAGVAADQYAWTAGGSATGSNSATLSFTSSSSVGSTTYAVSVSYSLPATRGGDKLTSCVASANTSVSVVGAPTTPSISIQ